MFQIPGVEGHGVGAEPVDDGDKKVEIERSNLAVVDDLRGLGEIDVADDRGE